MYVAERFSFPARCEFELRDIRAVVQNIAVPGDDPEAFSRWIRRARIVRATSGRRRVGAGATSAGHREA